MIPLRGIVGRQYDWSFDELKRAALVIDSFYLGDLDIGTPPPHAGIFAERAATFDFLQEKGILHRIDDLGADSIAATRFDPNDREIVHKYYEHFREQETFVKMKLLNLRGNELVPIIGPFLGDLYSRSVCARLLELGHDGYVPILRGSSFWSAPKVEKAVITDTIQITVGHLPTPDETTPWQDIIDFREEFHDRLWEFRRFLSSLATGTKTEPEVRDEIEWKLHQYEDAMRINKLKATTSFVETIVIPTAEAIENIMKFNWSKVASGIISVKKRQIELMEAERKAPGVECAYVFKASERFG